MQRELDTGNLDRVANMNTFAAADLDLPCELTSLSHSCEGHIREHRCARLKEEVRSSATLINLPHALRLRRLVIAARFSFFPVSSSLYAEENSTFRRNEFPAPFD